MRKKTIGMISACIFLAGLVIPGCSRTPETRSHSGSEGFPDRAELCSGEKGDGSAGRDTGSHRGSSTILPKEKQRILCRLQIRIRRLRSGNISPA